ncbi:MAG: glycosyltransferase [Lentisphaerae bacterium]|nr:glycosyltransferase [Lentisphaerota bacterium]
MRRLLIIITALVGGYYLYFRARYTLNPDQKFFSLLFYLAEIHGYISLLLFMFDMWRPVHPEPPKPPDGIKVDVFIPTYNEDAYLLRRTVLGAKNIRYPHTTYILDDGGRAEIQNMAKELGVEYISRTEHNHAKAGNINHALRKTSGEFIAIFDADHVPQSHFLDRTLGFFNDPEMAFVQTPQFFYNLSAFEEKYCHDTDDHWEQQEMFFHHVQPGKHYWNAAFFCGTCAIIRRSALEEVGGIAVETITEDIHTSLLMHARGWKSTYLDEHVSTGLAPSDVISYLQQRWRWALGNLRVMFIANPLFLSGLKLSQRFSYFSSMFSWTIGFQKIVYYLTPPIMLLTPLMPIDRFFTSLFWLYIGNLLLQLFAYKALTKGRGSIFMDELFNMLNYWFLIRSFFRAMFGLGQQFVVTDKGAGDAKIPLSVVFPQMTLMLICAGAMTWWILKIVHGINLDIMSSSIAAFWTVYIFFLAGSAAYRSLNKYDVRSDYRFKEVIPVWYRSEDGSWRTASTIDFNTQGISLLAYESLPMERDLNLRIMTETGTVETAVKILYKRADDNEYGVHSYGAKFTNLTSAQFDLLNLHTMKSTIPKLMAGVWKTSTTFYDVIRQFFPKIKKPQPAWKGLPISTINWPGEWSHGRIVHLSQLSARLVTKEKTESGRKHEFILLSPYGSIEGVMRVQSVSAPTKDDLYEWRVHMELMTADNAERLAKLSR